MNDFVGRRVAVLGLAATGVAVARVLSRRGADVAVYDRLAEAALDPARVEAVRALPTVRLRAGAERLDSAVDLVVPSPGVPRDAPPLEDARRAGIEIASEIEVAWRLARAPILAVTGTNGKTTTTAMLGAICQASGRPTRVCGNIAEEGGRRLPLIEAAEDAPADAVLVAEISSFQLEWVSAFRPRVAAWLNLSADHLDRYAGLEEYAATKARIFAAQTPEEVAVLNADDPAVLEFSAGAGRGRRVFFQGNCPHFDPRTGLRAEDVPLPGRFNRANADAASRMALAFGIEPEAVRAGLLGFRGVPHRMERVATVDGVLYINNSMCTNPAAVAASLEAAPSPVTVIAGGRHKGGDLEPMAEALIRFARRVFLIGEAAQPLAQALRTRGYGAATVIEGSLDEAVRAAAETTRPGEAVLLAPGCASFDMFPGFEARGQAFRDAVAGLGG